MCNLIIITNGIFYKHISDSRASWMACGLKHDRKTMPPPSMAKRQGSKIVHVVWEGQHTFSSQ